MATQAERRAAQLLRDHGLEAPAVDVEALAGALDISVHYERLAKDMSGVLLVENGSARVAINQAHHRNRQRFTLAHEIGHVLLHADRDGGGNRLFVDRRFFRNEWSSKGELREEIEANAFAASLLMPRRFFGQCLEPRAGITELDVFRLATRFEVSEQAMTLRLVKLGYIEPD